MTKTHRIVTTFAFLIFTLALSSIAHAQATRTWVSGVGDDVNPCSRTAPCKTFAGAISKTAEGGEINVLDPGGFGGVTITKAITIDGAGTNAHILASGTNGVIVNITSGTNLATAAVTLRNLAINGTNQAVSKGLNGIRWINANGNRLFIQNCKIFGFTTTGIDISRTANSEVYISDTTIENVPIGVKMTTSSGQVVATITNSHIHNCSTAGVDAISNVRLALRDTDVNHCGTGVRTSGTSSIINADDIMVSYAGTGIQASSTSTINVSDSMIVQNVTGLSTNGGTINSLQGNSLFSNTTDGSFSGTFSKQ